MLPDLLQEGGAVAVREHQAFLQERGGELQDLVMGLHRLHLRLHDEGQVGQVREMPFLRGHQVLEHHRGAVPLDEGLARQGLVGVPLPPALREDGFHVKMLVLQRQGDFMHQDVLLFGRRQPGGDPEGFALRVVHALHLLRAELRHCLPVCDPCGDEAEPLQQLFFPERGFGGDTGAGALREQGADFGMRLEFLPDGGPGDESPQARHRAGESFRCLPERFLRRKPVASQDHRHPQDRLNPHRHPPQWSDHSVRRRGSQWPGRGRGRMD